MIGLQDPAIIPVERDPRQTPRYALIEGFSLSLGSKVVQAMVIVYV